MTERGRRTGNRKYISGETFRALDVGKTVSTAITRKALSPCSDTSPLLHKHDLFLQVRHQKPRRLIVFTIDTSDSMADGPQNRMSAALGAIVSLASSAYLNRDLVSLVTFRDNDATVVVPPTSSTTLIKQKVSELPVGGATPLTRGLLTTRRLFAQQKRKEPSLISLMVLISDGDATMSLKSGSDPQTEAIQMAQEVAKDGIPALVIDTSISTGKKSYMRKLAKALKSPYHNIHHLRANHVLQLIDEQESH